MAEHLLGTEPIIEHPNRDKASSKTTRAVVVVLLLISAALILVITLGGWEVIQGLTLICLAWVVLYVVLAYYVSRWNRGVLPLVAALAIIMAIFALIAVPQWFDRDAFGFEQPALDANIVGTLTRDPDPRPAAAAVLRDAGLHPGLERRVRALGARRGSGRPGRRLTRRRLSPARPRSAPPPARRAAAASPARRAPGPGARNANAQRQPNASSKTGISQIVATVSVKPSASWIVSAVPT